MMQYTSTSSTDAGNAGTIRECVQMAKCDNFLITRRVLDVWLAGFWSSSQDHHTIDKEDTFFCARWILRIFSAN
jgi:hypothetical protein